MEESLDVEFADDGAPGEEVTEAGGITAEIMVEELLDEEFETTEEEPGDFTDFELSEEELAPASEGFEIAPGKETPENQSFEIKEAETGEDFSFAIEDSEDRKETAFEIEETGGTRELKEFEISDESSPDSAVLTGEPTDDTVFFDQFEKKITDKNRMAREEIDAFDPSSLPQDTIFEILNSDILQSVKKDLLSSLNNLGNDVDLFIKIIRYLENGPFLEMTLLEKVRLVDHFIEKFKEDTALTEKLIQYRDSMTNRNSLLNEVFETLRKIESESTDPQSTVTNQLIYLRELLANEEYSPVWRTIQNIYDNTLLKKNNSPLTLLEKTESEFPGSRVELLSHINNSKLFPAMAENIEELLQSDSLSKIHDRFTRSSQGKPDSIEETIRQVMKEDINLNSWMENFKKTETNNPEDKPEISISPENIKRQITAMLNDGDLTDDSSIQQFQEIANKLVQNETESTLPFLFKIMASENSTDISRNLLLDSLERNGSDAVKEAASLIRTLEGNANHPDYENLISNFQKKAVFKCSRNPLKILENSALILKKINRHHQKFSATSEKTLITMNPY